MAANTMKSSHLLRFVLLGFLLAFLPSCGLSFRSAWKKPASNAGVSGKWEGTWLSTASGHTGKLRAVISEPGPLFPASKQQPKAIPHQFFYHCTWRGILSAAFKTTHHVTSLKNGTYTFKGDHQMPQWVGGTYHYEGTIKGDEFNACYESAMDRGTFTMKRVR
jgi:hypothetical protein